MNKTNIVIDRGWLPKLLLGSVISLFLVDPGHAAQPTQIETQKLLEEKRQQERDESLTQPPAKVIDQQPVQSIAGEEIDLAAIQETGSTFVINDIEFSGDTLLTPAERREIIRPFLALPLGAKRMDVLLRRITAVYMQKGYITTRAYLGPQNMATGQLVITVIPGIIEKVALNGEAVKGLAHTALATSDGKTLRLADVEQSVDQINRLRSQRAEVQILPGQSPGSSVVAIANRSDKLWRIGFGGDNFGQSATGENRQRLTAEFDNLLGAWEALSFTVVDTGASHAELISVSVPFGYGTLSYTNARSESTVPLADIAISTSDSLSQTLAWNQVVFRDGRSRYDVDASIAKNEQQRNINQVALTPQVLAVGRLGLNGQWRFGAGSANLGVSTSQGMALFGTLDDVAGLPVTSPHNEFEKFALDAGALFTLDKDWAWRGSLRGQYADVGLPGQELLFIGGSATVRGFKESALAGDRGWQMRNELQWTGSLPRAAMAGGARFDPFLFYDYGVVHLLVDGRDQTLASAGFGVRAAWNVASLEVAWGRGLRAPDTIQEETRLHASFNFQF